jgi:hypothetical protein
LEEYSRFEPDKEVITVSITPEGTGLTGEPIVVDLVKDRFSRDVVVASVTLTLDDPDSKLYTVQFNIREILDFDAAPLVRRGRYIVRATSTNNPNVIGESPRFLVSLVTVDRLKHDYLHGTDLRASDVLSVKDQPSLITGVTVTGVSRGHPMSWFPLTYTYSIDTAPDPDVVTQFLSWCSGPMVKIEAGKTSYTLRRGSTADYITVRVDIPALPTTTLTEELLIERAPLEDARLRTFLNQAISWVEQTQLHVFLEPTTVHTQIDPDQIVFQAGSTIAEFQLFDIDCRVDAVTYKRPSSGHWINFRMPYFPVIRFEELFGEVSNTRILDVDLQWVETHEKGGFVELVPFNQEIAFNFIGLVWVESLRGPVPIPNFWNFEARVGFRKTPEVLLELIAKKAAIDGLTIAGQAFRGGISSQSVSRDGVSESVSYTASAIYGIYSASIEEYNKWIKATMKDLRHSFHGVGMVVL